MPPRGEGEGAGPPDLAAAAEGVDGDGGGAPRASAAAPAALPLNSALCAPESFLQQQQGAQLPPLPPWAPRRRATISGAGAAPTPFLAAGPGHPGPPPRRATLPALYQFSPGFIAQMLGMGVGLGGAADAREAFPDADGPLAELGLMQLQAGSRAAALLAPAGGPPPFTPFMTLPVARPAGLGGHAPAWGSAAAPSAPAPACGPLQLALQPEWQRQLAGGGGGGGGALGGAKAGGGDPRDRDGGGGGAVATPGPVGAGVFHLKAEGGQDDDVVWKVLP